MVNEWMWSLDLGLGPGPTTSKSLSSGAFSSSKTGMLPPISWVEHGAWTAEPPGTGPCSLQGWMEDPKTHTEVAAPGLRAQQPDSTVPARHRGVVGCRLGFLGNGNAGLGGMWRALWSLRGNMSPSDYPGEARKV